MNTNSNKECVHLGPNNEGCPCWTSKFGCCSDGVTTALGSDGEGCQDTCDDDDGGLGCCQDDDCDCAESEYQCCPDGVQPAVGPDFQGCDHVPGDVCSLPRDGGKGLNYTVR